MRDTAHDEGNDEVTYRSYNEYNIPKDIPCGYRETAQITDESGDAESGTAELRLSPKNMDSHKGEYLFVEIGTNNNNPRDFILTDSSAAWENVGGNDFENPAQGTILLEEFDGDLGNKDDFGKVWPDDSNDEPIIPDTGSMADSGFNKKEWIVNDPLLGFEKDPAQAVWDYGYSSEDLVMSKGACTAHGQNFNSCTPVHDGNAYTPDGQIIRGYEPQSQGGSGPFFYICREGNLGPSGTGKVIDIAPDNSGGLYKCDTTGDNDYDWKGEDEVLKQDDVGDSDLGEGKWVPVTQCMDDIDNDGEGGIDSDGHDGESEDTDCEGNPINPSEAGAGCQPFIGTSSNVNGKAAFYEAEANGPYSPNENSCNYNSYDDTPMQNDPEQFQCFYNSNLNQMLVENYEGSNTDDAKTFCWNQHGGTGFSQNPMPAVQYFVPKEVMPIGPQWANENGYGNGWDGNYGFQTLHQAENKYTPHEGVGPHDYYPWSDKQMENIDGYADDDYPVVDAWDVANASGMDDSDVFYPQGKMLDETDVFRGGFHGKCSSGMQWMYSDNEWRCDVEPSEYKDITVTAYRLNPGSVANKLVGFQINWTDNMEKWGDAHPMAPPEGNSVGVSPVSVEAMCWQGTLSQRPSSLSNVVNISAEVQDGEDTYVVGELRENPAASSSSDWSCVFGMTQEVDNSNDYSAKTDLFINGAEATDSDPTAYITEGTDDASKGQIRTLNDEAIKPVADMQTWLEGKEASATNQVFTHFVKSENTDTNRNPWKQCVLNGKCAIAGN